MLPIKPDKSYIKAISAENHRILWLKREGQGKEMKNQWFLENKHLKARALPRMLAGITHGPG